jgi:hypothetical protein
LVWDCLVGAGAIAVALDYRNIGLRVYDLMGQWSPGGADPRFSPDMMRAACGVPGAVFLVAAAARAFRMF